MRSIILEAAALAALDSGPDHTLLDSSRHAPGAEQSTSKEPRPHFIYRGLGMHCRTLQLALRRGRDGCRHLR